MRRVWLVLNLGSGSTTAGLGAALNQWLTDNGVAVAGCSDFPADPPPGPDQLRDSAADTLLICGGDGTINAAWSAADDWDGQCLVLPGGTMNGLAKALHGDAAWQAILEALAGAQLVQVPLAEAEGHHALVGVILGPAGSWVHAREGVRKGRFWRALRAARLAWARSFGRSVSVVGAPGRHRAVIITPTADTLEIATISAEGVTDVLAIGWEWLCGDWRAASVVNTVQQAQVRVTGHRTVRALFDGEPTMLHSPACVRHGRTRLRFLRTLP